MRGDHKQLEKADVQPLAMSVDHIWAHKAYATSLGDLPFPLLADWEKKVCRDYGVLREETGAAQRSLFLIDHRGYVRWRNPKYDWRDPKQYSEMVEAAAALPRIPKQKEAGS